MIKSVHLWGFYDEAGNPRQPDGAAPSDLSVYHHHKQVESNVVRCGGTIAQLRVTRTLDGWLVATEFETPARDKAARMWHRIVQPSEEWPA